MAKRATKKQVDDYRHEQAKRLNNPPAALAREDLDEVPSRKFGYDPHLPPELWWAGKDHDAQLEVEAPSIHIHERLSTEAIVRAAQKEDAQLDLFGDPSLDRSKAIEFYEHEMDWVNRLVLGDSLIVMTSLMERERLAGQVQMIYIDPPYGINYRSNFQPRISQPSPQEGRDDSITREPEQIQAYRDTWELGVHSYLTYLRSRLVVARDLLADSGSLFLQIGDDYCHLVRTVLDEVFGPLNCVAQIAMQKSGAATSATLPRVLDHVLWYARDIKRMKYREVYQPFDLRNLDTKNYRYVEDPEGNRREMTAEEKQNPVALDPRLRPYQLVTITSQDPSKTRSGPYEFEGRTFWPDKEKGRKRHWSVSNDGLDRLAERKRLEALGDTLRVVRYLDDFPVAPLRNVWLDTGRSGFGEKQRFVVQTNPKAIERCLLMTTDPGDLVLDPTCGSGTTAWVAEKHGRRWITTDTSRVALAVTRERLLSARFDFYRMLDPERGIDSGLSYESVQHIQPSMLAEDREIPEVPLRTRPKVDRSKVRVSGPFTVEGLSRYSTDPFSTDGGEASAAAEAADHATVLLDALRTQGIPRRSGKPAEVITLSALPGTGVLHAEGTFREADGSEQPFAVSLGPRHGPLTPIQVDEALAEAPGYSLIVFVGFAATAEAQEYLAPGKRGRVQVALLEANPDLLLGDLLKQTKSSQTFRLFSSPDVAIRENGGGEFTVEVRGMDTFDAATGETISHGQDQIACWLLDTDYDGAVFHANQAFFTASDAWSALGKALRGAVDEEAIAKLHSFESLPFKRPQVGKVAVRVIDDAGSTSERVLDLPKSPEE